MIVPLRCNAFVGVVDAWTRRAVRVRCEAYGGAGTARPGGPASRAPAPFVYTMSPHTVVFSMCAVPVADTRGTIQRPPQTRCNEDASPFIRSQTTLTYEIVYCQLIVHFLRNSQYLIKDAEVKVKFRANEGFLTGEI